MEKNTMSQVESHLKTMKTAHAALADTSDLETLWNIIHRPGWTTVAEAAFLVAALESMATQTQQLAALRANVLAAAGKVSTGQAAGA